MSKITVKGKDNIVGDSNDVNYHNSQQNEHEYRMFKEKNNHTYFMLILRFALIVFLILLLSHLQIVHYFLPLSLALFSGNISSIFRR